jgi:hypothetical protein
VAPAATDAYGEPVVWVTVFGYQPAQALAVLSDVQMLGDVVQYQLGDGAWGALQGAVRCRSLRMHRMGREPNPGNWMYVRFATPLEAAKALAANGRVLSHQTMVGFKPTPRVRVLLMPRVGAWSR